MKLLLKYLGVNQNIHRYRLSQEPGEGDPPGGGSAPPAEGIVPIDKWRETLPEDLQNEEVIKRTTDIVSMAKRLVNAEKTLGSTIKIPEDGDTAGFASIYNKLGRPENADGYKVEEPEKVDGIGQNEARQKSFLEEAHRLGLNNSAVNSLLKWQHGTVVEDLNNYNQQKGQCIEDLKAKWGTAYDERLALAQRAVQAFGRQDITDYMDKGAGNDPIMFEIMCEYGKYLEEDNATGDTKSTFTMTPEEAKTAIAELESSKEYEKAFFDTRDPAHKEMILKKERLYNMAYPGEAKV